MENVQNLRWNKLRTLVVDIDGIITIESEGFGKDYYPKRTPNDYNIETLKDYKKRGFKIILYSARYQEDYYMTEAWLLKHKVPFDKLVLGKPQGDEYIDDRATNQLDREVLCFSGGIDSLIALHYLEFPQPIYVMMGHRYQVKECECIGNLKKIIPKLKDIVYFDGPELGRFEVGDKAYIPQRNLHLALCASHFGNKIYIVGVKGDAVPDKTKNAYSVMAHAMNFIEKEDEHQYKIESPFWQMTKTDIIKWFLDNYPHDYVENVLKTSVSCYSDKPGSCGACPSCFRKWIALESAGIKSYDWGEKDIRLWVGIKEYKDRINKGEYDIQRSNEMIEVLEKYKLW